MPMVRLAVLLGLVAPAFGAEPAGTPEFFEAKVRPVLVEHCLKCHGGDKAKAPKGGLRVDGRAALIKGGDSGPALMPGEPAKSRLVEAINFQNADLQMPPKGKLADAIIADLTAWVKAGAVWPDDKPEAATSPNGIDIAKRKAEHWAWQPVRPTNPPAVKDAAWPNSPIDRFILAKLEEKGLKPAGPADRRSWIRRVTFDLIGLPPTPAEIDAFLADSANDAERKVVTRLLDSPHFGERWARHWLDLVRYAESRGHEIDPIIPNAFQYRDYVIRALNADVPYDQFVREHLAGDLLATPRTHSKDKSNESIVGTGFWFLGEEVHSPVDIRQDQADRFDNRIDVFAKTFLGLTVSCARCHDHKFDAISQRDYYALYGIVESSGYRLARFDSMDANRKVSARLAEHDRTAGSKVASTLAERIGSTKELGSQLLAAAEALKAGKDYSTKARAIARDRKLDVDAVAGWADLLSQAIEDPRHSFHALARRAVNRPIDPTKPAKSPVEVVIDYARSTPAEWYPDEGSFGPAPAQFGSLAVDGSKFVDVSAATYDRVWDKLTIAPGSENDTGAIGRRVRAGRTLRTPTFRVTAGRVHYLVRGAGMAYAAVAGHTLIHGPLHGHLVTEFPAQPTFRWVSHDLSAYKGQFTHIEFTPAAGELAVAMVVQGDVAPPVPGVEPLVKDAATLEDLANEYSRVVSDSIERWKSTPPNSAVEAALANVLLKRTKSLEPLLAELAAARAKIADGLMTRSRLALATWDANGVDENVFIRGSPKGVGERVPRRFLEALSGTNAIGSPGSGRLELANTISDPTKNPFVARVQVNRIWHHLFGRGLVASVDNFGQLGEVPTHPELLDFLADRYVSEGWSTKRLIADLVLSRTYRMATVGDPGSASADPSNLLLHRARLKRLDGESIRDSMLAISGRLDRTPFGPGVPIHLTPFLDGRGRPGTGPLDGNGRRSIYLAIRRNFLAPMLLAFDTPIPFSTVGRRQVSNVPAQALILMNDPFVHQQAALWAKTALARPGPSADRVRDMYLTAYGRTPTPDEVAACVRFVTEQSTRYGPKSDEAKAWADLAHTLFNAKEFVYLN